MGLNKLILASETVSADESFTEGGERFTLERFEIMLKFGEGEVYALQAYAHRLMESGIAVTRINAAAHPYFEGVLCRQRSEELERAREIAEGFAGEPFYWNCWMEK